MPLPQYFLQDLKMRNDILELAASYVNLNKTGKSYVGLCPFHNERTPSFHIYPQDGSFYCFGCNTGGDIITFTMKIEGLDYIEAVRFLAQRGGLQMPDEQVDDSMAKLRSRVYEINRESARFFNKMLYTDAGEKGLTYLTGRGLDKAIITKFGLGFSPSSGFALVNHLRAKGFTDNEMILANVAGKSKNGNAYDRFRDRIMFPIIDLRGNVVAFGGRILTDEKPKYINTSDTCVYHKSSGLFAMNFAKASKDRQLILAEGYMDVISLHQAGITNAIASLGTSLTQEQAKIISRYADEAVICYDSDEAGQRATSRAIPILRNAGLYVRVLEVPGNKDPDEYIRSRGSEGAIRFKNLLKDAGNDVEYSLFKISSQYDLDIPDGRMKYLDEAVKIIAQIPNRTARDVYAGEVAQESKTEKRTVLASIEDARQLHMKKSHKDNIKKQFQVEALKTRANAEKKKNMRATSAEEGIIVYVMNHPDKAEQTKQVIPIESFVTSLNKRLYSLVLEKAERNGNLSLTDLAGELTEDEMSDAAHMLTYWRQAPPTWRDLENFAGIIKREGGFSNPENIKDASVEEIMAFFNDLRGQKK